MKDDISDIAASYDLSVEDEDSRLVILKPARSSPSFPRRKRRRKITMEEARCIESWLMVAEQDGDPIPPPRTYAGTTV